MRNSNTSELSGQFLLEQSVISIFSSIDSNVAESVVHQLLYCNYMAPEKDITVYINSPGGKTISGFAILDTMRFVTPDIRTVVVGEACGIATVLLAAGGTKGKRFALPHSSILLHQPFVGVAGVASDVGIATSKIGQTKKIINSMLAESTGQLIEKIEKDSERDYLMGAREALDYGLIDNIIEHSREF